MISPFLANIYLHHVLDRWFEDEVKRRLKGRAFLVRYMDDAVICFQNAKDAQKVQEVLDKRFSNYGQAGTQIDRVPGSRILLGWRIG